MKTYFKKLNEKSNQSNELDWLDIAVSMTNVEIEKILTGIVDFGNKLERQIRIFYKDKYKSPIIDKLEKEKIYIEKVYEPYNIDPLKSAKEFHQILLDILDDYLNVVVYNMLGNRFENVDDDILVEKIKEWVSNDLVNRFTFYFINIDKKTDNYILCRSNGNMIFYYNCSYMTKNNNNSFGIRNGDTMFKEHLIEIGKESVGLTHKQGNVDVGISLYSGYFDDL